MSKEQGCSVGPLSCLLHVETEQSDKRLGGVALLTPSQCLRLPATCGRFSKQEAGVPVAAPVQRARSGRCECARVASRRANAGTNTHSFITPFKFTESSPALPLSTKIKTRQENTEVITASAFELESGTRSSVIFVSNHSTRRDEVIGNQVIARFTTGYRCFSSSRPKLKHQLVQILLQCLLTTMLQWLETASIRFLLARKIFLAAVRRAATHR